MLSKYKAVIFDLDGTLLNTLADLANSVNRVLKRHNYPVHDIEAYRYFIGDGAHMLITRALPAENRSEANIEICFDAFQKDYAQNWNNDSALYPGIAELMEELTARKMRLAVLSNKPHSFTQKCMKYYFERWNFDIVIGQQPHIPRKPDPAGALLIAQHLDLDPGAFCYVGDSAVDMQTARASSMFAIGVLWGYRTAQELREGGAQILVKSPAEISTHL